jgi:hypothetical protein
MVLMETSKPPLAEKNLWEDFRDTMRGGMRDLRNMGDVLARQGRLRMDIYQEERRLKSACEELGKITHECLLNGRPVSAGDAAISELHSRISYYEAELKRLHEEMQRLSEPHS